jgi:hypothetical protein
MNRRALYVLPFVGALALCALIVANPDTTIAQS